MATTTPTIGLKKPEGSDPFLTEDFAANYDKIDAAFAARPAAGSGGGVNADTLGGSPKSYFYGPHNPPPPAGVGSHTHSDYLTQAAADQRYAPISHGEHGGTGGGGGGLTQAQADSLYVKKSSGLGDLPESVVHAVNRIKNRMVYANTIWTMNGVDQVGVPLPFGGVYQAGAPAVFATAHVHGNGSGSGADPIITVNELSNQAARVRLKVRDATPRSMTSIFSWTTLGQVTSAT
jgi:hypothetical protein